MKLRVVVRLLEIQRVLLRHGLDDFVRATHLYRPLRFLYFLQPSTWFERRRGASRGERLRLARKTLREFRVVDPLGRQKFQRYKSVQGLLPRLVNDAHAAPAEAFKDLQLGEMRGDLFRRQRRLRRV